jgi:hypothetical protein
MTETVEAMTALVLNNFIIGAENCLLSALFVKAIFIIAGIPLEKIIPLAPPTFTEFHS